MMDHSFQMQKGHLHCRARAQFAGFLPLPSSWLSSFCATSCHLFLEGFCGDSHFMEWKNPPKNVGLNSFSRKSHAQLVGFLHFWIAKKSVVSTHHKLRVFGGIVSSDSTLHVKWFSHLFLCQKEAIFGAFLIFFLIFWIRCKLGTPRFETSKKKCSFPTFWSTLPSLMQAQQVVPLQLASLVSVAPPSPLCPSWRYNTDNKRSRPC